MSRLTLLHRDLSRRIESLKQIVEASQPPTPDSRREQTQVLSASTELSSGPQRLINRPQRANAGDMHSIDLNPNTNQLIIRSTRPKTSTTKEKHKATPSNISRISRNTTQRGGGESSPSLDEGFESDVDTISLVSTESTISLMTMTKNRETDSANGSASSDSDDSDASKNHGGYQSLSLETGTGTVTTTTTTNSTILDACKSSQDDEIITEYFNLVNCVCYTDSTHPDVLILVVSSQQQEEETLIFKFENPKELEAFHENFSTVKAVANQKSTNFIGTKAFNLLQRTDSDGMTHIRISRQDEEDFTSIISLPNIPPNTNQNETTETNKPRFEKFATLGKPPRKRILKKSKSIEDFLDSDDKPLRKIWNSAENILDFKENINQEAKHTKPKVPPRRGRKKGPAPLPPCIRILEKSPSISNKTNINEIAQNNLSHSFTSLHHILEDKTSLGLGNVFQGQFVRVQVDHTAPKTFTNFPMLNFRQKAQPEILKYENTETWKSKSSNKVRNYDAFKFSDPKNLSGYHLPPSGENKVTEKLTEKSTSKFSKASKSFSALKLYIPMYKSAKKSNNHQPGPTTTGNSTGNFTNRLFGMSSKLKEFSSVQSGCNPSRRYDYEAQTSRNINPYVHPANINQMNQIYPKDNYEAQNGRFFGRLGMGRITRSGSLGSLTLLAQNEKTQSNTLKSVIKKRNKDEEDTGRRFGRHGKKVTFSAYNTVQVV